MRAGGVAGQRAEIPGGLLLIGIGTGFFVEHLHAALMLSRWPQALRDGGSTKRATLGRYWYILSSTLAIPAL
jgi:hypothetical protein